MNEELVAHQSKILEFNEQLKQFAAHKKQFEADEAQRLQREAEWKQKENNAWLKELFNSSTDRKRKLATLPHPLSCRRLTRRRRTERSRLLLVRIKCRLLNSSMPDRKFW